MALRILENVGRVHFASCSCVQQQANMVSCHATGILAGRRECALRHAREPCLPRPRARGFLLRISGAIPIGLLALMRMPVCVFAHARLQLVYAIWTMLQLTSASAGSDSYASAQQPTAPAHDRGWLRAYSMKAGVIKLKHLDAAAGGRLQWRTGQQTSPWAATQGVRQPGPLPRAWLRGPLLGNFELWSSVCTCSKGIPIPAGAPPVMRVILPYDACRVSARAGKLLRHLRPAPDAWARADGGDLRTGAVLRHRRVRLQELVSCPDLTPRVGMTC